MINEIDQRINNERNIRNGMDRQYVQFVDSN